MMHTHKHTKAPVHTHTYHIHIPMHTCAHKYMQEHFQGLSQLTYITAIGNSNYPKCSCPLLEMGLQMSARAKGLHHSHPSWSSPNDLNSGFYYMKFGSDQISGRFTHILRIFMRNKQCYIQSSGLKAFPEARSARRKHITYGLHSLWVTHAPA